MYTKVANNSSKSFDILVGIWLIQAAFLALGSRYLLQSFPLRQVLKKQIIWISFGFGFFLLQYGSSLLKAYQHTFSSKFHSNSQRTHFTQTKHKHNRPCHNTAKQRANKNLWKMSTLYLPKMKTKNKKNYQTKGQNNCSFREWGLWKYLVCCRSSVYCLGVLLTDSSLKMS